MMDLIAQEALSKDKIAKILGDKLESVMLMKNKYCLKIIKEITRC